MLLSLPQSWKKIIIAITMVICGFVAFTPSLASATTTSTGVTVTQTGDTISIEAGEGTCPFTVSKCFVSLGQGLTSMGAWLLTLTGMMFDNMLVITVNPQMYGAGGQNNFIQTSWVIIRDITNIGFIFILIYIAVMLILQISGYERAKQMLVTLILVAVFINFSLFIGRVVIDVGNALGRVIYNNLGVVSGQGNSPLPVSGTDYSVTILDSGVEQKRIAETFLDVIDPQQFIGSPEEGDSVFAKAMTESPNQGEDNNNWRLALIYFLSAMVIFFAAYVFVMVSLFFITRIASLWLALIFSPLAFLTVIVPRFRTLPYVGWTNWWRQLVELSFMVPVFLFFIFLILTIHYGFLDGLLNRDSVIGNASGFAAILMIIIPFFILLALLKLALNMAKKMSGELGQMVANVAERAGRMVGGAVTTVATAGAGAAVGVVGAAGRVTAGRVASNLNESQSLRNWASQGGIKGFLGKKGLSATEAAANSSFDPRALMSKKWQDRLGGPQKGGFRTDVKERIDKETKFSDKYMKLEGVGKERQDAKNKAWEAKYKADLDKARAFAQAKGKTLDEKDFRKGYTSGKDFSYRDSDGNIVKRKMAGNAGQAYVQTSDEVTKGLKERYAQTVEEGRQTLGGSVKAAVAQSDVGRAAAGVAGIGVAGTTLGQAGSVAGAVGAGAVTLGGGIAAVAAYGESKTQERANKAAADKIRKSAKDIDKNKSKKDRLESKKSELNELRKTLSAAGIDGSLTKEQRLEKILTEMASNEQEYQDAQIRFNRTQTKWKAAADKYNTAKQARDANPNDANAVNEYRVASQEKDQAQKEWTEGFKETHKAKEKADIWKNIDKAEEKLVGEVEKIEKEIAGSVPKPPEPDK